MKLQELLKQNLTELTPQAKIIIQTPNDNYYAQNVVYAPELLNLGVILLGYYSDPTKVTKMSQLGDCLSVAHYIQSPRAMKYGSDFRNNPKFKALPAKLQKHLTGEIQDCTLAYNRDFGIKRPAIKVSNLAKVMTSQSVPYVYLYQSQKWQLLRVDGHDETAPADLRSQIRQLLKKKA